MHSHLEDGDRPLSDALSSFVEESGLHRAPDPPSPLSDKPPSLAMMPDAAAIRVQERATETLTQLARTRTAFEGQKKRFEVDLAELTRVGGQLSDLEARIGKLTATDQPLLLGEAMVKRLEAQVAEAIRQLQETVSTFEAEQQRIDPALAEVSLAGGLVAALEARIRKVTESDQPLALGQALVDQLQARAADTVAELARAADVFEGQRARFEPVMIDASRIGERISALEARTAQLTAADQPLALGEATVNRLHDEVAAATAELERTGGNLEMQQQRIEGTLLEIGHIGEAVSVQESRIRKFTDADQPLAAGQAMVHRLEECAAVARTALEENFNAFTAQQQTIASSLTEAARLAEHVSGLEARIAQLTAADQPLALGESTVNRLQGQVADATAELDRSGANLEMQQQRVEGTLLEIGRIGEAVSAQESRIRKLTGPDQPLAVGQALVQRLEERAVETRTELQETVDAFTAQKQTMASSFKDAARLAELVAGLEKRIAKLDEKTESLGHAEKVVGQLEQRTARTTAQLMKVARETGKLEGTLARLQKTARIVGESAQPQVDEVAGPADRSRFDRFLRGFGPRMALIAAVGGGSVLALGGVIAAGGPRKPPRISVTPDARPVLLSRALSIQTSMSAIPAVPSRVFDVAAIKPEPRSSSATRSRIRTPPPPEESVQPEVFNGTLSVESIPDGAAVFVDRQYVGETPFALTNLKSGTHVVWVEHEGHERWTAAVLVTANKQVEVTAKLQPKR